MNISKKQYGNPNPKIAANFVSKLSFWWLLDLFWYGKKHHLTANDLYDILPENSSETLGNELEIIWANELSNSRKKNKKPNLWMAIIKTFGWSFIKNGINMLILNIIRILQPMLLGLLIWYFDPLSKVTITEAYMYATGLVLVTILQTIIVRQAHLRQQEIGMRVKIACSSLMYRKVLKLSCMSANEASGGLIINLLSNDTAKFQQYFLLLHYIWIMPIILILVTYLVWQQMGIAALIGISSMIVQIIPTQVFWYKVTSKLRAKGAVFTDKRVRLIGEIINGINSIKMYAWEKYFEKLVHQARKTEIHMLLKRFYARSVRVAFTTFAHRTALFCTLLVYVTQGNVMSADKVFSTVHYYALLRNVMTQFFAEAVSIAAEVGVSIKRIEKFLLSEEVESKNKLPINDDTSILIREVKASWEKNSNVSNLYDINICIPPKKLYAVVGPVGSGKSSLLKLILSELQPSSGDVSVYGNVSYASQEPWLFTNSVRENIIFGEPYEEEKYNRVIKACALTKDFEQLPYGDKTLVGERGATLSGGQCTRVNLARAVYREADIYLFDDPLSAVDTQVGKSLFQDCINGLLRNKTRILVTHQIQYLKEADTIILLNNGEIEFQGIFSDFQKNKKYLQHLILNDEEEKVQSEESNVTTARLKPVSSSIVKIEGKEPKETEELLAKGRVAKSLYLKYLKAGSSYFMLSILLFFIILNQLAVSGFDYWLSFWTKREEKRLKMFTNLTNITSPETFDTETYLDNMTALTVCGSLLLAVILFVNIRNILYFRAILYSSKNIHNKMFSCLIRAPMQFFNTNPSGRIVNRFSKDTGAVDEIMPPAMYDGIERSVYTVAIIIQILIINWWIIFPIIVVAYFFLKINDIYLSTVQDIKRIEGSAKSPVFSLVNTSFLGLLTIRSCRAQKIVQKEFDSRQDSHTAAYHLVLFTSYAFGFWLDLVLVGFLAFVCYNFIMLNNENSYAGDVGLALTQILNICGMLQYAMKQVSEMMAQMTSVERMFQFTKLEQEAPLETLSSQTTKKPWPSEGEMKFENLYLRYTDEEEPILKNLNLTIQPSIKVGIVGRTGAGKSSLVSAILRLAKVDGSIVIDKVDTRDVGLIDLRTNISIIPQEPMVFTASLRDNLDPFHQYDDSTLWSALEEVELNKMFDSLDYPIDRGGGNLSAGQRQLLCLARAIVKKNKILILDEATANIDPATDDLIQSIIRSKFKDCTVLTIAHRLNTIMDSDKILVMNNGEIVEFDQPHVLLRKSDGYFSQLVRQSGNGMSQHLKIIAEKAFDRNAASDASVSVPNSQEKKNS